MLLFFHAKNAQASVTAIFEIKLDLHLYWEGYIISVDKIWNNFENSIIYSDQKSN